MRTAACYVPDDLWAKFGSEIDHFEYDVAPDRSVAVYRDGRREEFDSRVTPERKQVEQQRWLQRMRERAARGEIVFKEIELEVDQPRFHSQILGFTD